MKCAICDKKLRIDNTIGVCRAHRSLSEKTQERLNKWKAQNESHLKQYKRQYAVKNKERLNKQSSEYLKEPSRKMAHALRTRLNRFMTKKRREATMQSLLGCTYKEFIKYIESQFKPGMTWNNYGINGWHLDHKFPLSKVDFSNKEQVRKVCHYSNLQPLWSKENIVKRNRIESSQECPTAHAAENVR